MSCRYLLIICIYARLFIINFVIVVTAVPYAYSSRLVYSIVLVVVVIIFWII